MRAKIKSVMVAHPFFAKLHKSGRPLTLLDKFKNLDSARGLWAAIALAIAARIGVFVASIIRPISNERGLPVSPLHTQGYFDFQFYLDSLERYHGPWTELIEQFVRFYQSPFDAPVIPLISGPVFPLLMDIFNYGPGNFLPLAVFYLLISVGLSAAWLVWLSNKGVPTPWLLVFAVIPNPIWFTLVISPDLLFAALFAAFFLLYFEARPSTAQTAGWVAMLAIMLLLRPNGFSVLLFVALHAGWSMFQSRAVDSRRAVLVTVLLLVFGLYLYPYFLNEMQKAGGVLSYFGYTPSAYINGIYPALPGWIDLPLSWVALAAAKLIYFVGLRPSYGVTDTFLVLARGGAGLILLPGLFYLFWAGRRGEMALIALYCLPILLGPAQDRYYLPIYPILFLYGVMAYQAAWRVVSNRRKSQPT